MPQIEQEHLQLLIGVFWSSSSTVFQAGSCNWTQSSPRLSLRIPSTGRGMSGQPVSVCNHLVTSRPTACREKVAVRCENNAGIKRRVLASLGASYVRCCAASRASSRRGRRVVVASCRVRSGAWWGLGKVWGLGNRKPLENYSCTSLGS